MPNVRWLLALITSAHRWLFTATGGRVGGRALGYRFLLLEHTGRRSGQRRLAPLLYVEDGKDLVVVASNAGDDRAPAWWLNLRAHPEARVRVGTRRLDVRARQAGPEEAQRLWPVLDASHGGYAGYRDRAAREIPVVLLEPCAGSGAA